MHFRFQDQFSTNKAAAEYLKNFLDTKYVWLEWLVIAYTNKNDDSGNDIKSAHYIIDGFNKGNKGKYFEILNLRTFLFKKFDDNF